LPKQSAPSVPVQLPREAAILMTQLLQTDQNVTSLHPLLDLLSRPEEQKETLGERLEQLLTDLIQTLSNFQTAQVTMSDTQERLTQAIETSEEESKERLNQLEKELSEMIENLLGQVEERQARMEKKIDRILTMLLLPLD